MTLSVFRKGCNPRCRMSHMPKRFWKHMTEFQKDIKTHEAITGETLHRLGGSTGLGMLSE